MAKWSQLTQILLITCVLILPATMPGPVEHPFIRFLNKDLWNILGLAKQCMKTDNAKVCIEAKNRQALVTFTYKF